jgi:hypothetical protein
MIGQLIELTIIPIVVLAYVVAGHLTMVLNLGKFHFYFLLFLVIHILLSIIILISNYANYGRFKIRLALIGIVPTLVAIFTLFILTLLPFLKMPIEWIFGQSSLTDPLIMGVMAYLTQKLLDVSLIQALEENFQVDDRVDLNI